MLVRAILDWGITIRQTDLPVALVAELKRTFEKPNPKHYKLKSMGYYTGNVPAIVRAWQTDGENLILPRGALRLIESMLAECDLQLDIQDETVAPPVEMQLKESTKLRPHQTQAIEILSASRQGGILRGSCGSGKTLSILALLAHLKIRALVVMHNNALLQQWRDEVSHWLGFAPGTIVGGKFTNLDRPIVLAMQQTLCKHAKNYEPWTDEFGVVAADECAHVASQTYQSVAKMFRPKYFFGASADERRKDGMEFLTEWVLGPKLFEIGRDELVATGRLLPIEMKVIPTGYQDETYLETIENEESPNWVNMINRMLDTRNPDALKRYELIWKLVGKITQDENARVLVLCDRVEACQFMAARFSCMGLSAGLLIGSPEHRKELDRTIGGLRSGLVRVGCGTTVADEGLDVPALTHVILTSPCHTNPKRIEQMTGRCARVYPGKRCGTAVYLWDRGMFPPVPMDDVRRERMEKNFLAKLKLAVGERVQVVGLESI